MTFFKRKRRAEQLYVVKTEIISSYNDGTGCGPRCVTQYFLAKKRNEKYYELFSGQRLELEEDTHHDGFYSKTFDVPYIVEVKPISEYSDENQFTDSDLFYFITEMNTLNILIAFDEEDDDMPDEDFNEKMVEEE